MVKIKWDRELHRSIASSMFMDFSGFISTLSSYYEEKKENPDPEKIKYYEKISCAFFGMNQIFSRLSDDIVREFLDEAGPILKEYFHCDNHECEENVIEKHRCFFDKYIQIREEMRKHK